MTRATLHPPNTQTWITIICNIIFLVCAILAPRYHHIITTGLTSAGLWKIQQNPESPTLQADFITALWLITANLSSIVSLLLVNYEASEERGKFCSDDRLPTACSIHAKKADKKLKLVWGITFFVVLSLALVIFSILFQGPTHRVISIASVVSGGIYMFIVLINDGFGHWAIKDCERIKDATIDEIKQTNDASEKARKVRFVEKVDTTLTSLSFFTKVVFLVDIPILIGLCVIYAQEFGVMDDSLFRQGFSTGAIAMHIIAANLVSIMLSIFIFNETRFQSGTFSLSSTV